MKKSLFQSHIKTANFRELFITEMGWNNYRGHANLQPIVIENTPYEFTTIAERSGFQILQCEVKAIPTASQCRNIDTKLRTQAHDYIAIYVLPGTEHHLWQAPVQQVEKRNIVTIEYETARQADFLFSKIEDLSFDLDEDTTIVDVKQRIQQTFSVNSEKITKSFYAGFKKEHDAFAQFIVGIDDEILDINQNRNKQWYTSVMLNRLMFCYFIQKKGFLDSNVNYLRDKLNWCQTQQGQNKFFKSFYKSFLVQLFQDGLNAPLHKPEFERVYGKIPYLNGGMFDQHQIERDYQDIDIQDAAFERLFDFFDKWRWHLDTRISASGSDINPDVLGYIFEQYINDRAQMGAYYTKEDITEYISRNCILPFLLDKVASNTSTAFSSKGEVWTLLQQSGDRYLFDAVKQGYSHNWRSEIPEEIAIGLDTTQPHLLERRKDWNTRTPEPFALPTEIWRETIERLQRCEDIIGKISRGEIHEVNDFITYNLDIRRFTQELLEKTDNHLLVEHFYHALQHVTILDPTCGSGAFLFAALNILEPLYETCISRMQDFHEQNPHLFKAELDEIAQKYRSNIQYFIYKSIILRNLYGVDIMAEAVEIAKLRLFLKMVAVVDADRRAPNLGLDPLPDIDFNIRCGNTLVGYATEKEVMEAYFQDAFAAGAFRKRMETEMMKVAKTYDHFRHIQLSQHEDMAEFKAAKEELRTRLSAFTNELNHLLYSNRNSAQHIDQADYEAFLASHQPFHWFAEFYQIIHDNGGFDVIIGNPPYVVDSKRNVQYSCQNYKTFKAANLYAYVFERSLYLSTRRIGLIVQMSSVGTVGMAPLQRHILENVKNVYYGCYPERPKQLFEGACIALSIFLCDGSSALPCIYSSGVSRCSNITRMSLFETTAYNKITKDVFLADYTLLPKYKCSIEVQIARKILKELSIDRLTSQFPTNNILAYRSAGGRYWKILMNREFATDSTSNKIKYIKDEVDSTILVATLNSTLFWWYYVNYFDLYNLADYMIFKFPFQIHNHGGGGLRKLGTELMASFEANKKIKEQYIKSKKKSCLFESFLPQLSKPIIDEIDKVLAKHYGFTEEELDFIINYDIKYRMGEELQDD